MNNVSNSTSANHQNIKIITLDPGHFHAALVQKEMYAGIDPEVTVYAPGGAELEAHLALVKQYNERAENPTKWVEKVYTGSDYFEKMLSEKKGNVVVLSGNNRQKTEYINKAIDAGLHVLGDKPMAINFQNFNLLQAAFAKAAQKKLLLYDIMTERSEITNILQREFAQVPELFGELKKGTADDPSVIIESVHFFYKFVSGKVLTRPAWFFDPTQQGDAIADVGTHLIDLVQWECFPEETIDYKRDIKINSARIWPEPLTISQFSLITKQSAFPEFLKQYVKNDTILQTHGNGEINYTLKDVHVKTIARWEYKAPPGGGDTHYSILKGTKSNLEIKQGKEEAYQPTLYIIPNGSQNSFESTVRNTISKLNNTYAGVTTEKTANGWKVVIPQSYKIGHEAHFGQVMTRYLQYLKDKKLPEWEVPNMLAKYYTATKALEMATK
ncbi:putative oxidoreductase C-terminal domain-containing protein [Segetibacter sp.]|jgi:predicted dehydrogenase|uniref:putative oxidoreductase C-terminal domain-containing protein n=1 Tax=Segetibacter sp. TaxID=2231182 RepID=UPI0026103974|nr:putative oxidoreductase C-terminal domain-containing protein [Segetibacter sp.]